MLIKLVIKNHLLIIYLDTQSEEGDKAEIFKYN